MSKKVTNDSDIPQLCVYENNRVNNWLSLSFDSHVELSPNVAYV